MIFQALFEQPRVPEAQAVMISRLAEEAMRIGRHNMRRHLKTAASPAQQGDCAAVPEYAGAPGPGAARLLFLQKNSEKRKENGANTLQ